MNAERQLRAAESALECSEEREERRQDALERQAERDAVEMENHIQEFFDTGEIAGEIIDYIDTVVGKREWNDALGKIGDGYPAMNPAKVGAIFIRFINDVALRYAEGQVEKDRLAEAAEEPSVDEIEQYESRKSS